MFKIPEEVAIQMFNLLDELANVEDMDWARLGNFEDLSVEEFKEWVHIMMIHFDDPINPTIVR